MNRIFFGVCLLGVFGFSWEAWSATATQLYSSASGLVRQIKVLPDQAPDCSSLKTIAESVTRDCSSNDEKAIAIYNFMRLTHYHRAYPNEPGGVSALKEINCYGWSLCGGLHAVQSALWRELGWDWRFVGWNGHTTVEAGYDDQWHYLDVFLKFYAWMPDGKGGRTVASQEHLNRNARSLVQDAFIYDQGRRVVYMKSNPFRLNGDDVNWRGSELLSCGDSLSGVISGLKTHRPGGPSKGWSGIKHDDDGYSAQVNLVPGYSLENRWDPEPEAWYWAGQKDAPRHTCGGHKDTRNNPGYGLILEPYVKSKPARSYGNGALTFVPDLSNDSVLESFVSVENTKADGGMLLPIDDAAPGVVVFSLRSPYILTKAKWEGDGVDGVEISIDGGNEFKAVRGRDFSSLVKGQVGALVKLTFTRAVKAFRIDAIVQNNPGALPYLSPGKNKVRVSVADPKALGENQLVVTYAYRLGSRSKSFDDLCDEGKEIAWQHNAHWSEDVTCVQKVFSAEDLPATIEIDCPTPTGRYPVYPRMMFLRRELLAPGAKPIPLPENSVPAVVGKSDKLMSLPNPFLVGTEPPPKFKVRPVRTITLPMRYEGFSDEEGASNPAGTLRWPKNGGEKGKVIAGAVWIEGDLEEVEGIKPRDVAQARLKVFVTRGHNKSAGKLGCVFLEPDQPRRVLALNNIAATVIVPRLPEGKAAYDSPREMTFDVTRSLKSMTSGERRFAGVALRMVPDRGVDDGWTVRCDVATDETIVLEVDVYSD